MLAALYVRRRTGHTAPVMINKVPRSELAGRLSRFRGRMDAEQPQWALAAILGRLNQYYFSGTMQEGCCSSRAVAIPYLGAAQFRARPLGIALARHPADGQLPRGRPIPGHDP